MLSKLYLITIVALVFLIGYYKIRTSHLAHQNTKLKTQIEQLKVNYESCQQANEELAKNIQLQQEQYQKKVAQLLRKAQKPPKVIEVPNIIEKTVYVTNEDCQKMAAMIDEFIKIQRKGGENETN